MKKTRSLLVLSINLHSIQFFFQFEGDSSSSGDGSVTSSGDDTSEEYASSEDVSGYNASGDDTSGDDTSGDDSSEEHASSKDVSSKNDNVEDSSSEADASSREDASASSRGEDASASSSGEDASASSSSKDCKCSREGCSFNNVVKVHQTYREVPRTGSREHRTDIPFASERNEPQPSKLDRGQDKDRNKSIYLDLFITLEDVIRGDGFSTLTTVL